MLGQGWYGTMVGEWVLVSVWVQGCRVGGGEEGTLVMAPMVV